VSDVLNGKRYVSDGSRTAIEQAMVEVGYTPTIAARNLVRRRTQAVAFIVRESQSCSLRIPTSGHPVGLEYRALYPGR